MQERNGRQPVLQMARSAAENLAQPARCAAVAQWQQQRYEPYLPLRPCGTAFYTLVLS